MKRKVSIKIATLRASATRYRNEADACEQLRKGAKAEAIKDFYGRLVRGYQLLSEEDQSVAAALERDHLTPARKRAPR